MHDALPLNHSEVITRDRLIRLHDKANEMARR